MTPVPRRQVDPGASLDHPEWTMVGIRNVDGTVTLLASTKLTRAELDYERREYEFRDWGEFRDVLFTPTISLTVILKTFVAIVAPDYQTALASLFAEHGWRPDDQKPQQIEGKYLA